MNTRRIAGDVGVAFASQGVSLLVSALTSLLVPKMLGVAGFGYWQLFLFYVSYSGVFSLGLNDGVYLLLGGCGRDEADMASLHGQLRVGALLEGVLALVVCGGFALGTAGAERAFILVCTALYIVVSNAAGFLGYVFQAFGETRKFSRSVLVSRLSFLVLMVPMMAVGIDGFRPYVLAYLISQVAGLAWCASHALDILSADTNGLYESLHDAAASVGVGHKLLLANLASMLVLGVVRQAVDIRWGVEAFGQLSLSLSLVSFALSFVSQVGMVLFPALRRAGEDELRSIFERLHSVLAMLLPVAYAVMPALASLLMLWLPAYAEGIGYLAWLMPMVVFDGQMSLLGTTYLKVLRMEGTLLRLNVAAVAVSGIGACIAVFLLGSIPLATASSVAAISMRSLLAEYMTARELGADCAVALSVGEVTITIVYLLLNTTLPLPLSTACYLVAYAVFLLVFRSKVAELRALIR